MKNNRLSIIAGPCSIDENNIEEIYEIADLTIKNRNGNKQKAIYGVRIVGLKSRTELDDSNEKYMGMDFEFYMRRIRLKNVQTSINENVNDLPPSVKIAQKFISDTGLLVATEIVMPDIQIPFYSSIPDGKMLFWNPAVNQLGWTVSQTAKHCIQKKWFVGLKNGKWFNQKIEADTVSSAENTWLGLSTYATGTENIVFIQRGFDIEHEKQFRNYPIHKASARVKQLSQKPMFFDPSHTFGQKLRDKIVDLTIEAMMLQTGDGEYLYDGLLIETGNSKSVTNQHITIAELKELAERLDKFRDINSPNNQLIR